MKLKRFLLRYDPPGLGLELETSDGNLNTKHIDVFTSQPPNSTAEIEQEAKRVIDLEAILNERKHLAAIIQLLHRLPCCQLEARRLEEEVPAGGKPLNVGDRVVLVGLKDSDKEQKMQLNGELGQIAEAKPAKDKYKVFVDSHQKEINVKGRNAVPLLHGGGALTVDSQVVIRGLRNHVELNGCFGRVTECHDMHRYEVRANESGQLFRVKHDNLVPVDPSCPQVQATMAKTDGARQGQGSAKENRDPHAGHGKSLNLASPTAPGADDGTFKPGTMVRLTGLKTAMAYNGQTAEVLAVDVARSRYEIKLADGSVKTVRAENVERM